MAIACVNACTKPTCNLGWDVEDDTPCTCEGFECDGCLEGEACWVDGEVYERGDGVAAPSPGAWMLRLFGED